MRLPCGHDTLTHQFSVVGSNPLPNKACMASIARHNLVNQTATDRSRDGDGRFIEAGTVEATTRPLHPMEQMARSLEAVVEATRGLTG